MNGSQKERTKEMAAKIVNTSGAFATSGSNTRVLGLILTGTAAVDTVGTAVIKTGGTGGTEATTTFYVDGGKTVQLDLRGFNVIGDFITLANCASMVHFKPSIA